MGTLEVTYGELKEATLEAVIIRADGTEEDLGVIAEYKKDKDQKILKDDVLSL